MWWTFYVTSGNVRCMPRPVEDVEMKRVIVSVPEETHEELVTLAERSGVRRSHFLAMAVVLGARVLDRQLNPTLHVNPAAIEQSARAMVGELLAGENRDQAMALFKALEGADVGVPTVTDSGSEAG